MLPNPSPSLPRRWAIFALLGMFMSGLCGGAAGAALTIWITGLGAPSTPEPPAPPTSPPPTALPVAVDIHTAITDAVAKVSPAVVTVVNHLPPRVSLFGEIIEQTTSGSGVIITPAGHIVTNNHVVQGAERLEVILANGSTLPAQLVGVDPYGDLAVIKAQGQIPAVAEWGDSDALKPGETVIAIGSPLGSFKNTVTVGVVSATGRSIDTGRNYQLEGLIQTDAAINQGNSGGPLVNLAGQVVGINTLIVRGAAGGAVAEGLGFAIPSNIARAVADRLIRDGYIARPYLGVEWGWITPEVAARFGIPVEYGVYISRVVPGGPADRAGLRRGDIILGINGQPFDPEHPFVNLLFQHEPGMVVTLQILRSGKPMEIQVELGARPAS